MIKKFRVVEKKFTIADIDVNHRSILHWEKEGLIGKNKETKDRYRQKIQTLLLETKENQSIQTDYKVFLKSGINLLTNFKKYYVSPDLTSRMRLLSSIFPEKLIFEENKSRTPKINEALRLLLATDKGFNEKWATQIFTNLELSLR